MSCGCCWRRFGVSYRPRRAQRTEEEDEILLAVRHWLNSLLKQPAVKKDHDQAIFNEVDTQQEEWDGRQGSFVDYGSLVFHVPVPVHKELLDVRTLSELVESLGRYFLSSLPRRD